MTLSAKQRSGSGRRGEYPHLFEAVKVRDARELLRKLLSNSIALLLIFLSILQTRGGITMMMMTLRSLETQVAIMAALARRQNSELYGRQVPEIEGEKPLKSLMMTRRTLHSSRRRANCYSVEEWREESAEYPLLSTL
jgi:hypothetical protein